MTVSQDDLMWKRTNEWWVKKPRGAATESSRVTKQPVSITASLKS